ncbi:MAG: MGMT family protein [Candidatus Algichlamydia australiensis]|nr:MGMT family protein [Chlamydiales bacterium]
MDKALSKLTIRLHIFQEDGVIVKTRLEKASQFEIIGEPFSFMGEYLEGKNLAHLLKPLPLRPFSRIVLEETARIPFGQTISYSGLAEKIGRPTACRAVAMALHHNPLPLFIPCHRVIAKDGSIGGFGFGVWMKKKILSFENQHLKN